MKVMKPRTEPPRTRPQGRRYPRGRKKVNQKPRGFVAVEAFPLAEA